MFFLPDREEFVLQGNECDGRGVRYSEAELKAIVKVLGDMNNSKKKVTIISRQSKKPKKKK